MQQTGVQGLQNLPGLQGPHQGPQQHQGQMTSADMQAQQQQAQQQQGQSFDVQVSEIFIYFFLRLRDSKQLFCEKKEDYLCNLFVFYIRIN